MIGEEDTEHVPDFSLVPVGALVDAASRFDRRQLVRVGFNSDAIVVAQREEIIDNLISEDELLRKFNIDWYVKKKQNQQKKKLNPLI